MQEFRPTNVIDQDTRLAESLIDGDFEALVVLVARYARAVRSVVATSPDDDLADRTADVFARAWLGRERVDPSADFAPWLGGLAAVVADRSPDDAEEIWAVATAIDSIDDDVFPLLRAHHVEGGDLPDDVDRHELRLRRRLTRLGDDQAVAAALAQPTPWSDPDDDLVDRIRTRLGVGHASDVSESGGDRPTETNRSADAGSFSGQSSRVGRSLRPVLLGLGGAVAVLFVAIIALSAASGSPDPVAFTADFTPTGAIADVEGGELTVTERDSGLRLGLEAATLPRRAGDQFYEAVLVLQDGSRLAVGTFNEGFGVILSAGVELDRVEEILVVARDLGSDDSDIVLKLDVPRR